MAFGDLLKGHIQTNDLIEKYKALAHFFVTECSWSQQQFDEAEIEFMNDIVEYHIKVNKKNRKKR